MKLLCGARHTGCCPWDSHATGCSGESREHPPPDSSRTGPRGFHPEEPDTSVSPSNGILEVAISHSTIPKLGGNKRESRYSCHRVVLPSSRGTVELCQPQMAATVFD